MYIPSAGIDTAGAGYNGFPARTCRHGFSCTRGSRRSYRRGQRRARLSTRARMPRPRTRLCEAGGPRLRVPHFGRDEGHAADASWAGELLRRGGCIQFLWLDWDGEKRLQNVLVLCACWIQFQAVYAQAHRLRKSIWLVRRWGQAGVRVECGLTVDDPPRSVRHVRCMHFSARRSIWHGFADLLLRLGMHWQLVQRTAGWHGNVVAPRALRPRALR
ncbi:hypothetical protein JB92DRAFT_41116 [Gautieria morchelliformis]|nr:hypothetical protein JB92DRAFT_41116 [Gautieria morchelliformis]